jgi:hypothetical protein
VVVDVEVEVAGELAITGHGACNEAAARCPVVKGLIAGTGACIDAAFQTSWRSMVSWATNHSDQAGKANTRSAGHSSARRHGIASAQAKWKSRGPWTMQMKAATVEVPQMRRCGGSKGGQRRREAAALNQK